jgi:plastocyanin
MNHLTFPEGLTMRPKFIAPFIVLLIIGCGQEQRQPPPKHVTAETSSASPTESPGTIVCVARFLGTPPTMPEVSMNADRKCAALHDQPVRSEQVLVGEGGALQNVFVYIKGGLEGRNFPRARDTVVLDQQGCVYKPRVIGLQVNQPLLIVNSDPTMHNVHAMAQVNRGFNIAQPRRGMTLQRTFTQPEVMVRVKCDVHPWMAAYIGVMEHPYFAVSGSDGTATLNGVPPGEYVIAAWHERYGEQEQRMSLGAAETKRVEFRFKESL